MHKPTWIERIYSHVHALYRSHTGGIQCTTYHYTADSLRLNLSYDTLVLRLGKQTDGGKLPHWREGGNNEDKT